MTAQLQRLIDKRDSFELVRDKVAVILLEESDEQQRLALSEGLDPEQWKLRVFSETSTPWTSFQESEGPQTPIVNVWFETMNFVKAGSNPISRQNGVATIHVDCYGFGFSKGTDEGHTPSDAMAAEEAARAVRLVRNILMSGFYTYLGFPQGVDLPEGELQVVRGRWPTGITAFQPAQEERPVERVAAMRLDLEVSLNEFGPEYEGEELETTTLAFTRSPTGEWFAATYGVPPV
jgi:hypothetical protein